MDKIALWLVATLRRAWMNDARRAVVARAADGSEVTLIAQGDAFDLMHLPRTGPAYVCAIDAPQARAMLGLLARWWVCDAWLGVRLGLWRWAVRRGAQRAQGGRRG